MRPALWRFRFRAQKASLKSFGEGLSPNGEHVPGYIELTSPNTTCPASWRWNTNSSSYGLEFVSIEGTPPAFPLGGSLAANNAGQVTGWYQKAVNGQQVQRGFRTLPGSLSSIGATSELNPPDVADPFQASVGLAINSSGRTVGTFSVLGVNRAGFWENGSPSPVSLGVLNDPNPSVVPSQVPKLVHSEAIGINSAGRVVGKSWGSTTGASTSRALIVNYPGLVAPRDLNDRHILRLSSSWTLEEAVTINDQNYIVCLGTISGAKRAFLLVPRQLAY